MRPTSISAIFFLFFAAPIIGIRFSDDAFEFNFRAALLGLSLHLTQSAEGIAPEQAAAWVQTDEGRSFMRRSADAWSIAQQADGASADVARGAADATYSAYIGETAPPAD